MTPSTCPALPALCPGLLGADCGVQIRFARRHRATSGFAFDLTSPTPAVNAGPDPRGPSWVRRWDSAPSCEPHRDEHGRSVDLGVRWFERCTAAEAVR